MRHTTWRMSWIGIIGVILFSLSAAAQTHKPAAKRSGEQTRVTERATSAGFGVAESLTGRIAMVLPEQKLLIVSGPNEVPYDFKITDRTVIVFEGARKTLEDLKNAVGKSVSVGFVPERDGNYAHRVEVSG